MNREILLIEPNYKCKYPPMGLMKIATYYKRMGDNVTFFKGNLQDLVLENIYLELLKELYKNNSEIFWEKYKPEIWEYLKTGKRVSYDVIPLVDEDPKICELLKYYRKFFYKKKYFLPEFRKYDRVGITTLFTFHWDITIKTINFAKQLCKDEKDVMIGGVMASILPDQIEEATGIRPFVGILDQPGVLDEGNEDIIDQLPLDYSILEEIDYEYPTSNAYFAYMTRGCINKCPFCAVPKLEPVYKEYIPVSKQIKICEERFGPKKDLMLLDNNVLASCKYKDIIEDIKKAGFVNGGKYYEPNHFEIAVKNLRDGVNDRGYIKFLVKEFRKLLKSSKCKNKQELFDLLEENYLLKEYTAKKDKILELYPIIKPYFDDFYSKVPKKRVVDFNQGIDSRLINDQNMAKLSEIPIKPVRIAFDHWELHDIYERSVRCAARNGLTNLSNYVLYNFKDSPLDLYKRLKLNVELCSELGISIYSFPMKYHPIEDPLYFSNRDYIGEKWNRKFIRTVQSILNSTKGKVGRGKEFFEKAFGCNEEEFFKILYMPEEFIIHRLYFENLGLTDKWWNKYKSLSGSNLTLANNIIESNDFTNVDYNSLPDEVNEVLSFYRIKKEVIEKNSDKL